MRIGRLVAIAHAIAREKGWHDTPRSFGDVVALVHTEVSEAFEEHRGGAGPTEILVDRDTGKPEGIPIELADIVIRVADYCGEAGIDLTAAIKQKLKFNRTRPHRHGGKVV